MENKKKTARKLSLVEVSVAMFMFDGILSLLD
jgi:hypothetical protein